ncbi:hypothetical protein [Microcoleus sp. PH2017_28_MFU_U_A]|uniref:hypothetical protein n=1 Tax=Microcoleus sp. PH2017_28_MFU_U_A TaxID=2798838 RepID=UPI001DB1D2E4|nr:hypothetical protein [Microcoleus sp. PH2017_28_MFU_U_A]MCC3593226.1 hypothetical protein [Microcoleus sp. PH2017_28_MFU_U_A]
MSNQPEHRPKSQDAHAGRDIIQVGRDYIQNIHYNLTSGSWIIGILQLLPLGLITWLIFNLFLTVKSSFVYGEFSGSALLNQGTINVISSDKTLLLSSANQGSQSNVYVSVIANSIPLSEYQQGTVHIGEGSGVTGLLHIIDVNGTATYQLNTVGTDLTLSLDKNPLTVGAFMEGRLHGKVTDGNKSKQVDLKVTVPVQ